MNHRVFGNEYRTTIICIDDYEDGVPVGRFYHPYAPNGEKFRGIVRFLSRMEDTLDRMNYPQAFTTARAFSQSRPNMAAPSGENLREGKLATFAVRILFRQNASWQGSVTWLEGDSSQSFRSVLELILLMDSALEGGMPALKAEA